MLLPLDTFRAILGYQPWWFYGFASEAARIPVNSKCNTIITEYAWQNADMLGRSDMRRGIEHAEDRLLEQLGYAIAPHYAADTVPYPRFIDQREMFINQDDGTYRWRSVFANEKKVQKVGVEAFTLLGTVAVTYSDLDGDGLNESFSLTVAAPDIADLSEIAVYFNATDRFTGEGPAERWRIQPVRVVLAGGTATITGQNAWILGRPILYESATFTINTPLDPLTAANFAQTLDVYRRYCNPNGQTFDTSQALLIWETPPYTGWNVGCCGSAVFTPPQNSTDAASQAYALARAGVRNGDIGALGVGEAVYDSTSAQWIGVNWLTCWRPPERVTLRYEAGWPLDKNGHVARQWAEPTARLAVAEMQRRPCGCDVANREWYDWAFDMSRAGGNESYTISREDLVNPFGTRRGHIDAWRIVRGMRALRGIPL